jgi:hypothetical protein
MRLTFIELPPFTLRWRKEKLADEKLQEVQSAILDDPEAGDSMPRTGGLRKLRLAPPKGAGKGKSFGYRVIYAHLPEASTVYFFAVYGKWDKADLTADDEKYYRDVLTALKQYHRQLAGESERRHGKA